MYELFVQVIFPNGIRMIILKNNILQFSLFQEYIIFIRRKQVIIAVYNHKSVTFMHKFNIAIYI